MYTYIVYAKKAQQNEYVRDPLLDTLYYIMQVIYTERYATAGIRLTKNIYYYSV